MEEGMHRNLFSRKQFFKIFFSTQNAPNKAKTFGGIFLIEFKLFVWLKYIVRKQKSF